MNDGFEGKRAVVTGGGIGIGQRIALDLAQAGAHVIAADRDTEGLQQTRTMAGTLPLETHAFDVTDEAAVQTLMADHGTNILVHSAGGVCGQVGRPLEEIGIADFQAILSVNLIGAFLMARAAVPGMKARQSGRIVIISSGAGLGVSLTGIQAYAAAKAAEIGLTRQLAHELGPFGITVNSVAPGFIRSNAASERQWQAYGKDGQQQLLERIAMRRIGTPHDIANAVLFLASDQSSWITGQTLSVDGGK